MLETVIQCFYYYNLKIYFKRVYKYKKYFLHNTSECSRNSKVPYYKDFIILISDLYISNTNNILYLFKVYIE